MDQAQRGPCTMTSCQIFSRPVRPNSGNKHFIILPPSTALFLFVFFVFFRVITFGMFTYVAHFARKVGIYLETKLF